MLRGEARAHAVGESIQIYLEKTVVADSQFPIEPGESLDVAVEIGEDVLVIGPEESVDNCLEHITHD